MFQATELRDSRKSSTTFVVVDYMWLVTRHIVAYFQSCRVHFKAVFIMSSSIFRYFYPLPLYLTNSPIKMTSIFDNTQQNLNWTFFSSEKFFIEIVYILAWFLRLTLYFFTSKTLQLFKTWHHFKFVTLKNIVDVYSNSENHSSPLVNKYL